MKIGIQLPILTITDFGYQYNADISFRSLSKFADKVYCRLNSPINDELLTFKKKYRNIILISNKYTQSIDNNGNLIYNLDKNQIGNRYVLDQMRKDGIDLALNIHINQYIPEHAFESLRKQCQNILIENKPYGWLYKRYQLKDKLFHADVRLPWILNLQYKKPLFYSPDSISDKFGTILASIQTGDFRRYNKEAIVDVPMELTLEDLKKIVLFTKNMAELRSKKKVQFEHGFNKENQLKYYIDKFSAKYPSSEKLEDYGNKIAQNAKSNFLSKEILKNINPFPLYKRIFRGIKYFSLTLKNYFCNNTI